MGKDKQRDLGLLVLRLGIGLSFLIIHGLPKLLGGPARWAGLGGAMGNFGVAFAPTFWGFLATMAEFGGGILLLLGLFVRPAAAMMAGTMLVAATMHLQRGDGWGGASHAIEMGVLFLSLILVGGGRFSLDFTLRRKS